MSNILRNFWQNVVGIDKPMVRPRIDLRPRRRRVRNRNDEQESESAEDEGEDEFESEDEALAADLETLEQQANAADDSAAFAESQAQYAEQQAKDAFDKAQAMGRLAALVNPYKQAVAFNGPNVPQLQMLFGLVKTSLGQKQFGQASEALDLMEAMLRRESGAGDQEFGRPGGVDDYGNPIGTPYGDGNLQPGFQQQPGYPQPGFQQPGYPQPGFQQPGYPQAGFQQPGYPQPGYPAPGMDPYQMPGNQGGVPGLMKRGRPDDAGNYGISAGTEYGDPYAQPGYPAPGMDPYQTPTNYPGAFPGQNPDLDAQLDAQQQHAQLSDRSQALFGAFNQAMMSNDPNAPQMQSAFDSFQSSLDNQQFPLAEEWLTYLEQLLGQPASAQPGQFDENANLENFLQPFGGQETDQQQPQQMAFPGGLAGVMPAALKAGLLGERPMGGLDFGIPGGEIPLAPPEFGLVLDDPDDVTPGTPDDEQSEVEAGEGMINPFPEEDVPPAPPQPTQAVNANCAITVTNNTAMVLTLADQTNSIGDFMTNPASSIQPGGSTSFVFVHTPNDNNPADAGCAGELTWQVGKPVAAIWKISWNNFVGQKNTADGLLDPQTAGFLSLEQIGQGDENVPVTFTISGGNVEPAPAVPELILESAPVPPSLAAVKFQRRVN